VGCFRAAKHYTPERPPGKKSTGELLTQAEDLLFRQWNRDLETKGHEFCNFNENASSGIDRYV
jgi:hypothetical protein